jgi:hypothetical protein
MRLLTAEACDDTWTVDVEPAEQASDVMSTIKRVLS